MISSAARQKNTPAYGREGVAPRRNFSFKKSKLPALILLVILVYLIISFASQFTRLWAMQRDLQQIQYRVDQLQQTNNNLKHQLELVQSNAYIEQVAREKLGLVKPGESRIVQVQSNQGKPAN